MALAEGIGSFLTGSVALMADAMDFVEDAATYWLTLFVLGRSLRWRAAAGAAKGLAMLLPGIWVAVRTVQQVAHSAPPGAISMGAIGVLALVANVTCVPLLARFRAGDSNVRSAWLSTRNDAIADAAIILAAVGVAVTGTPWPDLVVGIGIVALNLHSAYLVIRQALRELSLG